MTTKEEILASGATLEQFVLKEHGIKDGIGWYIDDHALIYYNTGYEATHTIPDWDKLRQTIIDLYEWVETVDDVYDAFSDAVSEYRLRSRG